MSWNNKKPRRHNGKFDKKLTREFVRKTEDQLGQRYKSSILLGSYRNIFYNIMSSEELSVLELSILLWGNQYQFFTRKALLNHFYAGIDGVNDNLKSLRDKEYIKEYAPKQEVQMTLDKGTYKSTEDVYILARYHLTRRGTQLCNMIIDEIDSGLVDAFNREDRDYDGKERYIIGLYKKPKPNIRVTPARYRKEKDTRTKVDLLVERLAEKSRIEREGESED